MKLKRILESIDLKNVAGIEMDGVELKDHPKYTDAFVAHAIWKDSGEALSDAELEDLNNNYQDFVHQQANEHAIDHTAHTADQRDDYR